MTCSKAGPYVEEEARRPSSKVGKQRRGRIEGRRQWLYRFTTVTSVLITCHRGRTSVDVLWMAVRLPGDNARLRPVVGIF